MSSRQILSHNSNKKLFDFLQPAPAWTAILALVLFTVFCLLLRAGSIVQLAFPVGSFAVGLLLYRRYPILYVGFTWWLWLLSPLVSRIAGYVSGAAGEGKPLIIVTPYVVTVLTFTTFLRHLPKTWKSGLPFVLAFAGVFYSFLVGMSHHFAPDSSDMFAGVDPGMLPYAPMKIAESVLSWLAAILFGFYLFVNWRDYPSYRQNFQRTFLWGVLVAGAYGIVQYTLVPDWDRFWFINSPDMQLCCGSPEPFMLRLWSTSNTPATFSSFMVAGLLLLFSSPGFLKVPAAVAGYLAFLLSAVRAAWGGWFIGLLTLIVSMKPRYQMRLLVTILAMGLIVSMVSTIEPFSEVIATRFQTFSNIQQDQSLSERSDLYNELLNRTLTDGLGRGMGGGKIVDAGILDVLSTLGWFGLIPFLGGSIMLLINIFLYPEGRFDPFMSAARAISLGMFMMLPATNTMMLLHGMIFWSFAGMAMAAHKYYQHQNYQQQNSAELKRRSAT